MTSKIPMHYCYLVPKNSHQFPKSNTSTGKMTRSNLLGPRHDYPTTEIPNILHEIGYLKKSNHNCKVNS